MSVPLEQETGDTLSSRDPGHFIADLALEINGTQIATYPVSVASALSGVVTRSPPRVLFFLTSGDGRATRVREPGLGFNLGHR